MVLDISGFVICSAVITASGAQLSRQGTKLADLTGLSNAWIGLILMASVTSLPELVTGISAVTVVNAPDLAVGNVIGSCAFNLLFLSLLDLFLKKPLTSLVRTSHILTGAFSIILLAIAGAAISINFNLGSILWISPVSIILMVAYVLAMKTVFVSEKALEPNQELSTQEKSQDANAIKKVLAVYSFHAVIVVLAALLLPYFGERIALQFNLTDTLFGTVFLAIATSLPEVVVCISALRLGAPDMAMGNLLGSNVFNMAILALFDFFYTGGSLFTSVSDKHILTIYSSIIMTAIVAIGLVIRPQKKRWHLGIDGWIIIIIYLANVFLLR